MKRPARLTLWPLALPALLGSCMWQPMHADDYSVLGNDALSNMIRQSQVDPDQVIRGGGLGVDGLDEGKLSALATDFFRGKRTGDVSNYFWLDTGVCVTAQESTNPNPPPLRCAVERRWRLKNVGNPFSTLSDGPKPGALLVFDFSLNPDRSIKNVTVTLHDLTDLVRKEISK